MSGTKITKVAASPDQAQKKFTKFIIVTGGVLSGIGKGVLTASIGSLLSYSKLKIIPVKCDGYLNADPGTMNPIEHGEVFVLDDGGEVDMDFGHYERFFNIEARREWNITMGKIYKQILDDERKGKYLGKTVQLIPHATDKIKKNIYQIAKREDADIMLVEIGGTVGDMENELFIESIRQMRNELGRANMMFIHVTYVPFITGSKELKSKPTQNSVKTLQRYGIYPDMIVCRCPHPLDESFKKKVALYCDTPYEHVISGIDVNDVNELPLYFDEEGVTKIIKTTLNLKVPPYPKERFRLTRELQKLHQSKQAFVINIAICGKYTNLEDSYASIKEALVHCEANTQTKIKLHYINTELIKNEDATNYPLAEAKIKKMLKDIDGVIIPGGFGVRGVEGKIAIIRYLREQHIPFLGICLGMQLAIVEFARTVAKMKGAHTREISQNMPLTYPVIDFLPGQLNMVKQGDWGGTMRLGGADVLIKSGTLAHKVYKANTIRERFRHRYEVNPKYVARLEKHGLRFSGLAKNKTIRKIVELPEHPFFIGSQFHPELISRLDKPAPLFLALTKAAIKHHYSKTNPDKLANPAKVNV